MPRGEKDVQEKGGKRGLTSRTLAKVVSRRGGGQWNGVLCLQLLHLQITEEVRVVVVIEGSGEGKGNGREPQEEETWRVRP